MTVYKDVLTHTDACDMIDEILENENERVTLSDWEENFLTSMYNSPYPNLTLKQTVKLWDIYNEKMDK